MDIQQKLVATMVTACIIVAIALFIKKVDTLNEELTKYLIAAVVMLVWFFFIFIADLYMSMSTLSKKLDTYNSELNDKIRKRIDDAEAKCGKKMR